MGEIREEIRKAKQADPGVRRVMLAEDHNCAETVVLLGNERYGLGLSDDAFRLLSGFGGGMCVGKTCGAVTGAIAVLGKLAVKDRAHRTENWHELVEGLFAAMNEAFGATDCDDIVPLYRTEEERCCATVDLALEVLDDYLREQGLIGPDGHGASEG